jgi:peptidoglycan/xylan/chitin deacetylase (PgdA/CDA1 family)
MTAAGAATTALTAPWLLTRRPVRCRALPALAGRGEGSRVALTFDDGPDPASTPRFLAELDRLGWKATFFMLGYMVDADHGLAAEVEAAGHEVAVHGYRHVTHIRRTPRDITDDVLRATDAVAVATDTAPRWFRPPYGTVAWGTARAARRAGLQMVLWTSWGRDWRSAATPESVTADVDRTLEPGGTVLLHDSDCTSAPGAWHSALGALGRLKDLFDAKGLTAGPLGTHGVPDAAWPRW